MEEGLVMGAFDKATGQLKKLEDLIVHSDGGGQYASAAFRRRLAFCKCRQSMTRKDNHYDNAHTESLFSRFKAGLLNGGTFYGSGDARSRCFEFIEGYYNTIRRHSALGNISPLEFEKRFFEKNGKT